MATTTTNLGLILPAYSDTADIKDINDNMEVIDQSFGTLSGTVSTHTSQISNLQTSVKNITRSGTTFTATRQDGTTFTFTQESGGGTTYGVVSKSANGLAPKLPNETTTTKYLCQDGTWAVPPDNNTTYSGGTGLSLSGTTFNHASSITAGTAGQSSASSGATLAVPYVTYNGTGHITAAGTHTHTIGSLATSAITSGVLGKARGGTGSASFGLWGQSNGSTEISLNNDTWTEIGGWHGFNEGQVSGIWLVQFSAMFANNATGARAIVCSPETNAEEGQSTTFSNAVLTAQGVRVPAYNGAPLLSCTVFLNTSKPNLTVYGKQTSGGKLKVVATTIKYFFLGTPN